MLIERKKIHAKQFLVGYHTQECRVNGPLESPILCNDKKAWLGAAYYFWTEEEYAKLWGIDFKMSTGFYDVYRCLINIENFINTVFDEEGYFLFKEKIEETIAYFESKNQKVSLFEVNKFLNQNVWPGLNVDGVIYDDKPWNTKNGRVHSKIPDLYYKKRIQVAVFSLRNIRNFEIYLEEQC